MEDYTDLPVADAQAWTLPNNVSPADPLSTVILCDITTVAIIFAEGTVYEKGTRRLMKKGVTLRVPEKREKGRVERDKIQEIERERGWEWDHYWVYSMDPTMFPGLFPPFIAAGSFRFTFATSRGQWGQRRASTACSLWWCAISGTRKPRGLLVCPLKLLMGQWVDACSM